MRTPSPSWCGLDRTHLWPTGSSLGDPLITARNFSSCPSDSISRWTPCPPETASGGFRSALAVSDFRLRARLDVSIPSTSPASEAFNPAFGYSAPHPSTGGTSTLLINALLSAHHESAGVSWRVAVVRSQSGIAHCRGSQCPAHYKSTVAACCGTGAGFASAPASERLESDRCRESGAAVSRLYVSGSRPTTRVAG